MDDLERLLIRREAWSPSRPSTPGPGSAAFVGQVTSTGTNIAAGKYLLVTPQDITGTEAEGGSPTFTGLSGSVPVYVTGPRLPATGDKILCRRVDYRWVANLGAPVSTGGGGPGNMIGCECQGVPETLVVTPRYTPGESAATYGNGYQVSTLRWYYPGGPPYAMVNAPGAQYYSESTWFDANGFECFYSLSCSGSQFRLAYSSTSPTELFYPTLFDPGGPDGSICRFNIGATNVFLGTNTCSPFKLPVGVPVAGSTVNFGVT